MKKLHSSWACRSTVAMAVVAAGASLAVAQGRPDASNGKALVTAARDGDDVRVKALLKNRTEINEAEADGTTALMWAAYRSDADLLRALVAAGADVNARNSYGLTPLLLAARVGNADMITALLKAGADIKSAERRGETPLMAAAMAGNNAGVKALIKAGSDVNAREQDRGQTALMWAASKGSVDVVNTLLAAGADPNVAATESALVNEARNGARVYVNYARGGLTALMFAAREGHVDVAKALVKGGARLDVTNASGLSPMLIAVLNDWRDLAAVLLDAGANPSDGSLYEAIKVHNLRVGATASDASRPRPDNRNDLSPVQLIERLVEKGADANVIPAYTLHSEGVGVPQPPAESAFATALQSQDVEVLRILLQRKAARADAVLAGPTPATPLMAINTVAGGPGIFGGVGAGGFRHPGERDPAAAARLLIEFGADVNQVAPTGETAAHRAAQQGQLKVLRLLADNGAKLDVKEANGLTPLDFAMGKSPPPRGGNQGDEGGFQRRPRPQPEAAALLRELLNLPADKAPAALTSTPPPTP
jgi:uncharacterized protein